MNEIQTRYAKVTEEVDAVMAAQAIALSPLNSGTDEYRKAWQVQADRNLGSLHLEPQPLTDWGDREDHAAATLHMGPRSRDRLIVALIAGEASIEVYGASGGGCFF